MNCDRRKRHTKIIAMYYTSHILTNVCFRLTC